MRPPVLPPLQFLPAFEAAARHLSFKSAARELHVTPSAISQQLKQLEAALGVRLFERQPRAVELTEAGKLYLVVTRDALEGLRRGTALVRDRYRRRVLRLNTDAAVAHDVLIPTLPAFERIHRDLDLRIETSSALIDLRSDAADAAVRFGSGPWPGTTSELIAQPVATVVAAPSLLARRPLRRLEDLAAHTLLAVEGAPDYWEQWAAGAGFKLRKQKRFDSYLATLQAASHGLGVALALLPISTAWLREGRLVAPLDVRVQSPGYHLVCRLGEENRPDLRAVRKWLRESLLVGSAMRTD